MSDADWWYEGVTGWKFLKGDYNFQEAKNECEMTPGGYLTNMRLFTNSVVLYMITRKVREYGETPLKKDAYIGKRYT